MRPAFAAASVGGQAQGHKARNDAFTYNAASETDDFGSFSSGGAQNTGTSGSGRKKSGGFKPSAIIVAVAAIVAVILLIVLIVAIAGNSGKNVEYENNSFVAFCDEDGIYRVAVNGKVVGELPADSNAFIRSTILLFLIFFFIFSLIAYGMAGGF